MVSNTKDLVLRTDNTNQTQNQEQNNNDEKSTTGAPTLPPIISLPSIAVTTPTGETFPPPPPFNEPRILPIRTDWKAQEAALDRDNMPSPPPPAYSSTAYQESAQNPTPKLTTRQRRLNLPKLNPHARVSSINPAKSPIDVRKWHEKRRNISFVSGGSILLIAIALIIYFAYIVPRNRGPPSLTGSWKVSDLKLQNADGAATNDACARMETIFESCASNRLLQSGSKEKYAFKVNGNDNGTLTGNFPAGIFNLNSETGIVLNHRRMGYMNSYWYNEDNEKGKLSEEGCIYGRGVYVLVSNEEDKQTVTITEIHMVEAAGDCILPRGVGTETCTCNFVGTRS